MGFAMSCPTLEEDLRHNKLDIQRSIRELDRERARLETEEKRMLVDLRAHARRGETTSAQMLVKDYVRLKQQRAKFLEMRSRLQTVLLKLQTIKSSRAMSQSIQGVANVITRLNSTVEVPKMEEIMRSFAKENDKLNLTEDMLALAMDDVDSSESLAEEEGEVLASVMAEAGLHFEAELSHAPDPSGLTSRAEEELGERLRRLREL